MWACKGRGGKAGGGGGGGGGWEGRKDTLTSQCYKSDHEFQFGVINGPNIERCILTGKLIIRLFIQFTEVSYFGTIVWA